MRTYPDRPFHNYKTSKSVDLSRRALSQFWSFTIRRTTFLNYIEFVDPRIYRSSKIGKGHVGYEIYLERKFFDLRILMLSIFVKCSFGVRCQNQQSILLYTCQKVVDHLFIFSERARCLAESVSIYFFSFLFVSLSNFVLYLCFLFAE